MEIGVLHKRAGREIIDYSFLISELSGYAHPRDKISAWLKSGDLIRVKKGLYIFGKDVAATPYSHNVLANLIYGPSAISLSYALAFYGLIPERVTTVTSITNKRKKFFSTPVGDFSYEYLNPEKYPIGIELHSHTNDQRFLIASREKALCDHIYLTDRKVVLRNLDELEAYLLHDLRIEKINLQSFRISKLDEISKIYNDTRLSLLTILIKKWKKV